MFRTNRRTIRPVSFQFHNADHQHAHGACGTAPELLGRSSTQQMCRWLPNSWVFCFCKKVGPDDVVDLAYGPPVAPSVGRSLLNARQLAEPV